MEQSTIFQVKKQQNRSFHYLKENDFNPKLDSESNFKLDVNAE